MIASQLVEDIKLAIISAIKERGALSKKEIKECCKHIKGSTDTLFSNTLFALRREKVLSANYNKSMIYLYCLFENRTTEIVKSNTEKVFECVSNDEGMQRIDLINALCCSDWYSLDKLKYALKILVDQKRVSKYVGPSGTLHYFVANSDIYNQFKFDNPDTFQKYSRHSINRDPKEPPRKYKLYESDDIVINKVPYSEYTSYQFRSKDSKPKSTMHWVASELQIQNSKNVEFLKPIHINHG